MTCSRPEEDIIYALNEVNAAISKLVNGERLRLLTVGSGEFQRRYSFAEITMENLQTIKADLLRELQECQQASGRAERSYRANWHKMSWNKGFRP